MSKILSSIFCLLTTAAAWAQDITLPPSGDNQKASITQWIGLVSVTIDYSSPDVHTSNGADRKGHIWGELVPYGYVDQGFGTSKAAPWRAGANENTRIVFSHDVKVNGQDLKAGAYALFLAVEKDGPWTWIFSKNSTSWGSYFYDVREDALRVQTTPTEAPYTEWLTYGFDDRQPGSATAYLQWENKRIPFKIEVPDVNSLYVNKIREELRSSAGFTYQSWAQGAQFLAEHKLHLDEALTWADYALHAPFIGEENFTTLQTKSMVLTAMGKETEAETFMEQAIKHPTASMISIHQYGRSLLAMGKHDKALMVFKYNREAHPSDKFTTYVGLARGYSAIGDKKNAIKNWEIAIRNLPADQKQHLPQYEAELKKLKG